MDSLAMGGNPVGAGRGRGACLWRILMVLSLITDKTASLLPENHFNIGKLSPVQNHEQYFETTLTEPVAIRTHYDCKIGNEKGNCIHNGTQYKMCQSDRK